MQPPHFVKVCNIAELQLSRGLKTAQIISLCSRCEHLCSSSPTCFSLLCAFPLSLSNTRQSVCRRFLLAPRWSRVLCDALAVSSLETLATKPPATSFPRPLVLMLWLPAPYPSQRSLHSAPIFRLLLKVAVNGTHQCDFHNFWGALCSNCTTSIHTSSI